MTTDVTARDFNPSNNSLVDEIKAKANALALVISELPECHRRTVALDNVEAASMFAVKAVFYNDNNERTGA